MCIAALESPHGLRTIVPMGASLPLEVGSAGRILGPDETGAGASPRAPGADGWVESVGEREAGVASVSAGVREAGGSVVAAVSVSGPIERLSSHPGDRYGGAVVAAARQIERAAGLAAAGT